MKTCLIITIILAARCCFSDQCSYVTLTSNDNNSPATLQILSGQTAQIMSISTLLGNGPGGTTYPYSQTTCLTPSNTNSFYLKSGSFVAGPATITVLPNYYYSSGFAYTPTLVTVQIIPQSYDPNKTLIIPPGTNQVQITLQVSPDLVNWSSATNGVYGSPNTAQFFRISEVSLGSP